MNDMTTYTMYGQNSSWKTQLCSEISKENTKKYETVRVAGWVHFIRDKGKIIFIQLRDASGLCQITLNETKSPEEAFKNAKQLSLESIISVEGIIKEDARSINGAELIPSIIFILSKAEPKIPIDINEKVPFDKDTEFRFRELSIRTKRVQAIMNVKSEIAFAVRNFFRKNGFFELFTPYILSTATEGGAEKFETSYFGKKAFLAQSCQFYKQAAVQTHEKVFGIIPSWRAEKSRTPKHITEFHQIENEIAFGTNDTIMEIQENLLHEVVKHVKEHSNSELVLLNRTDLKIPELPMKRVTFAEAKKILREKLNFEEPADADFTTPEETALSKYFPDPFFITKFPTHLRGIYYETDPENEKLTDSMDCVAPEGYGEMSSGGQRVASKDRLLKRLEIANMDPSNFEWYIRMFEYGFPPHAGYGLGFERLIRWICGLEHIREGILFPRTPDLVTP
ncbi:MAG: Asparagine--tRNA ligase [Candidatus Heimdallarchaeota archaeon LC_3]|nr:MAG: Asparagine--tRNA ligase [Candidatus Heimdallarchaeota archaeon LC_3]